jgi:hypothetical protein
VIMGGKSLSGLRAREDGEGAVWEGELVLEGAQQDLPLLSVGN